MSGETRITLPRVTRVEVITARGRAYTERFADGGVFVDVQDEGRTLKVFAGETYECLDCGRTDGGCDRIVQQKEEHDGR